jgi:hypothetical protein
MRRFPAVVVIFGIIVIVAVGMRTSAQNGPPGGPDGGFHIIPPLLAEKMKLTKAQQKKLAKLERDTKAKLYRILTPEQQQALEEVGPPRPGQGGPGGGWRGWRGPAGGRGGPGGPGGDQGGRGGGQGGPGGDMPPPPDNPQ